MTVLLIFIALGLIVLACVSRIPKPRGHRPKTDRPPPTDPPLRIIHVPMNPDPRACQVCRAGSVNTHLSTCPVRPGAPRR